MTRPVCICVPARNEAARLPILIAALADQEFSGALPVSLCINNSDDGSATLARDLAVAHAGRLDLHVVERTFPAALAHVGSARRCAMEAGAALLGEDARGVLISTDADCRPPRGWVAAILAAIDDDRIVGGRIEIDEDEAFAAEQRDVRLRLDRYWEQVRAIEDEIDLLPWDAPPRHGDHTGASLAMTIGLYRAAGGVPLLATGEDRALVDHARLAGGRLVHPPAVWTRCSPRTEGRAPGGMATAMAAMRAGAPRVPSYDLWRERALWRRRVRDTNRDDAAVIARERVLPPMPCDMELPE